MPRRPRTTRLGEGCMKPIWPSVCLIGLVSFSPVSAQLEVLQKKSCDLPAALSGATGHVLMRYHVTLDGKVNFVEPVFCRVAPADKKAPLEEHLKECLSKWSYRAPGKTTWVQSYLELLVAFHYFAPTTATGP